MKEILVEDNFADLKQFQKLNSPNYQVVNSAKIS